MKITPFDSVKKFLSIDIIKCQHYSDLRPLCNKMYHKGIPFAEHNIGPFQDIFFIIVLFESQSKTLFRVLFSSLYQQICIFYFAISKYLNFTRELRRRSTGNNLIPAFYNLSQI